MPMHVFLIASFAGMLAGALLQYVFGLRAEHKRHVVLRRSEAYVELVRAVCARIATAGAPDSDAGRQAGVMYGEARTKLAIYGSEAVISRLARAMRQHPDLQGPEALAALAEVVKAMREDGIGRVGAVADADIRRLVFDRD